MKEMTLNKELLDISEEKNIKGNKIYLRNININYESYEAKILSEENIDGVIKYQAIYEGEKGVLAFDVGNSISLEEYIKSKHLKKQDVCDIVTSVDEVLMSIENYLVSENSICLDPKLIRVINAENKLKLKFIVIPNYDNDFSYELSKLLIRVLRFIDVEDKEALNLAYGLFVRSSKDNYLISDLMELIDRAQVKIEKDVSVCDSDEFEMYDNMISDLPDESSLYDGAASSILEEDIVGEDMTFDEKEQGKGLIIDNDTKAFLEDEIYEDFEKEDKKIIRFNNNGRKSRRKRKLNAHININYLCSLFIPFALVVVPVVYYIVNGKEVFIKNLLGIFLYEIVVIVFLIANKIMNHRMKSV